MRTSYRALPCVPQVRNYLTNIIMGMMYKMLTHNEKNVERADGFIPQLKQWAFSFEVVKDYTAKRQNQYILLLPPKTDL